jgi:hypothetical protein
MQGHWRRDATNSMGRIGKMITNRKVPNDTKGGVA